MFFKYHTHLHINLFMDTSDDDDDDNNNNSNNII
jgi:hypothetical protein